MPQEPGQVPTTWKRTVDALIDKNELASAFDLLEIYKQQAASDLAIRIKLAEVLHKMQRVVEAKIEAEEADAIVSYDGDIDDQRTLIKLHLKLGSDHRACTRAQNILRKNPTFFEFRWISVESHLKMRELHHARDLLKDAEALSVIQASDLTKISFYYRQVHRRYMMLLTHQKNDFRPIISDMKMALMAAQRARAMDAQYVPAQLAVAEAAQNLGDSRQAVNALKTFADPDEYIDADQRMQAAELLERCGEAAMALEIARSAATASRWNISNQVRFAHLLLRQGFRDEASKFLDKIEIQKISSKIVLYNILDLYSKFGRQAEVLSTCDRILDLFPYDDVATKNAGWIKMMRGQAQATRPTAIPTTPKTGWFTKFFSRER